MFSREMNIADFDPELADAMSKEVERQEHHIELIASENYCSPRVMEAQGSQLTNKYAEGYPGKRYYGGCEHVDVVEQLAIDRAKALFGADYANVQPHAGSQANSAVFMALLDAGDTVLGMSLSEGGHLTHGSHVNFSGKTYNAVQYGLNKETGAIDYAQVEALAKEHKPKMIIGGFSAYSGIVDWAKFREIADSVGAYLLVDMAHVTLRHGRGPQSFHLCRIRTKNSGKIGPSLWRRRCGVRYDDVPPLLSAVGGIERLIPMHERYREDCLLCRLGMLAIRVDMDRLICVRVLG